MSFCDDEKKKIESVNNQEDYRWRYWMMKNWRRQWSFVMPVKRFNDMKIYCVIKGSSFIQSVKVKWSMFWLLSKDDAILHWELWWLGEVHLKSRFFERSLIDIFSCVFFIICRLLHHEKKEESFWMIW